MFGFFKEEKVALFLGGVVAGIAGLQVAKTKKARELTVQGIAQGIILKDTVMEEVTNLREEAEEICNEAKALAKKDCDCGE
ncbi:DUF6110 family protein [Tannockella kyphosi]|uniref:DUF6110 family protein n=1 Tax=Tannockella kyphosi TaxID=2899121 RepID=UPI002013A76B|nr:DUF6110 family protein [Tannockella kyphosi]